MRLDFSSCSSECIFSGGPSSSASPSLLYTLTSSELSPRSSPLAPFTPLDVEGGGGSDDDEDGAIAGAGGDGPDDVDDATAAETDLGDSAAVMAEAAAVAATMEGGGAVTAAGILEGGILFTFLPHSREQHHVARQHKYSSRILPTLGHPHSLFVLLFPESVLI